MMINTKLNKSLIILTILLTLHACGKLKGEFAIKTGMGEKYIRIKKSLEFHKDKAYHWAYTLKKVSGKHKVGILILKKNIVWVEIIDERDFVSPQKTAITGTIKGLKPGNYKLILTDLDDREIIDTLPFLVYKE